MAEPYINVFMDNPTAGAKDGVYVSTNGAFTAPIEFVLDAAKNESQVVKLAVRTEAGYKTTGTTTITDKNDTDDRLKLCWTENGEFADSISTAEEITNANKIFYAKASSSSSEDPQTDTSAKFLVDCVIASVS